MCMCQGHALQLLCACYAEAAHDAQWVPAQRSNLIQVVAQIWIPTMGSASLDFDFVCTSAKLLGQAVVH